jgi:1-deoxy-D-xylulose-5-phosphate synthase
VVTVEDGLATNGVGSALRDALAAAGTDVPVRTYGVPHVFLEHASRAQLVEEFHLRGQDIARETASTVAGLARAAEVRPVERPGG